MDVEFLPSGTIFKPPLDGSIGYEQSDSKSLISRR